MCVCVIVTTFFAAWVSAHGLAHLLARCRLITSAASSLPLGSPREHRRGGLFSCNTAATPRVDSSTECSRAQPMIHFSMNCGHASLRAGGCCSCHLCREVHCWLGSSLVAAYQGARVLCRTMLTDNRSNGAVCSGWSAFSLSQFWISFFLGTVVAACASHF